MKTLKKMLWIMTGHVYLEDALHHLEGPTLLHISDTPSGFFSELKRLIGILKPEVVIHTGDLVDDLKLELYPSLRQSYETSLVKLMKLMNESEAKRIIFLLGNHDDLAMAARHAGRVEIYPETFSEVFHQKGFRCAHNQRAFADRIAAGAAATGAIATGAITSNAADFYLFGHDLSLKSQQTPEGTYLNGIEAIHLIELDTGTVHAVAYPAGTDSHRLNRYRIGF